MVLPCIMRPSRISKEVSFTSVLRILLHISRLIYGEGIRFCAFYRTAEYALSLSLALGRGDFFTLYKYYTVNLFYNQITRRWKIYFKNSVERRRAKKNGNPLGITVLVLILSNCQNYKSSRPNNLDYCFKNKI